MSIVYIAEDDESIRLLVLYALQTGGFEASGFPNGEELIEAIARQEPDLLLLDIMLPDQDGISILSQLRRRGKEFPVIMLTAKNAEYDKVTALDTGADDYITKPFGVLELVARINALLRRSNKQGTDDGIRRLGEIMLDEKRRVVTTAGVPVTLTYKEFELLAFLLTNRGIVLTRDQIMQKVWGFDFEGESRTVDMHIKLLRQKLADAGTLIQTVRGVGYKIELPAAAMRQE